MFREPTETGADLKRLCKTVVEALNDEKRLKALVAVQEMMTCVQFAKDECDYGGGNEPLLLWFMLFP